MIKEKEIKKITQKIAKEYKPEKIILFGSFAWGKPTDDSDVDLFIIKDSRKKRFDREAELRGRFSRDEFPAMDIMIYTPKETERSINEYKNLFVEDILRHGKILYANRKKNLPSNFPKDH